MQRRILRYSRVHAARVRLAELERESAEIFERFPDLAHAPARMKMQRQVSGTSQTPSGNRARLRLN